MYNDKRVITINYLPNMTLANKHAGMMNRLSQTHFEYLSLQTSLQEILDLQAQHIIELHVAFVQHTDPHQTTQQSISWRNIIILLRLEKKRFRLSIFLH